MPTIDTTPAGQVVGVPALLSVEVIPHLSDAGDWQSQDKLYASQLRLIANGIDEAILLYQLGDLIQEGDTQFTQYSPQDLVGKYVRVTIPQDTAADIVWIGYILQPQIEREGVKDAGGNKLQGRFQRFLAVGLEYFLNRKQVFDSVVRVDDDPDYVRIERPMVFNGGASVSLDSASDRRGNRATTVGADGVYHFADDPTTADEWTAEDIIVHLLEYYTPRDSNDAPSPTTFELDIAPIIDALDQYAPEVRTENMTVFEILNTICSPQRGLQWWAETFWTDANTHLCRINIQTHATAAVSLPGGGTFPANDNQQTVDFDQQDSVVFHVLKSLKHRTYHRFMARGARMTTTCTIGRGDETIDTDWTAATETSLKAGASGDTAAVPAYAGLSTEKKGKRNDAYRKSEQFYRVYCAYRIPTDWDGKTGDGDDVGLVDFAMPIIVASSGSVIGGLPLSIHGLRLLNRLRIKQGWGYEDVDSPTSTSPTASQAEYAPPFAFVAVSPSKYQFTHSLNDGDMAVDNPVSSKFTVSYGLRMQTEVPGFVLLPGGSPNHGLALNHWTSAEPTNTDPQVDYDTLRATVCIEADAYAEAVAEPLALPANTPIETLYIHMGDNYRLDYMPANTVYDIINGEPVVTTFGGRLRDDRLKLQDIAELAFEWYSVDRQSMVVTFSDILNVFALGMMITTAGAGATEETLNTVVSRITYDLVRMGMTIETSDDTLDVRSLAR